MRRFESFRLSSSWTSSAAAMSCVAALTITHAAHGQDAQDVAAARTLGQKGTLAAQAGRCEEAVDLLMRARTLMPVPTILVPLGECQIKLGKLVDGTEALQAAVRTDLDANAPKAFVKAQSHARDLLLMTQPRIAHLTVTVKAPKGVSFKVTDNGQPVNDALVGVDRPVDPGSHAIEASAPGYIVARTTVSLGEGQKSSGSLELVVDPSHPAEPPKPLLPTTPQASTPVASTAPPPKSGRQTQLVAGAVTLGVGGATAIVGGVLGGLALSKKSSLNGVCTNKQCPATSQSDIDSMKTFANASTALIVIGGVAAASGIVVLVTLPSEEAAPKAVGVRPNLYFGLGDAGIVGSF